MDCLQSGELSSHLCRQSVVRAKSAREQRIAERLAGIVVRHFQRVERRARAWRFSIRRIGVPDRDPARVGESDRLASIENVRDHQDFRVSGEQVLLEDMDLELTEPPAERDLLVGRQLLIAKDDDRMLVIRVAHALERRRVELTRQIDADDLGADRRIAAAESRSSSRLPCSLNRTSSLRCWRS
jgi:hypothetical protein